MKLTQLTALVLTLLVSVPFRADASTAALRNGLALWGGAAPSSISTDTERFGGYQLTAGMQFPLPEDQREAIRLSVARVFDQSPITRYNLLAHVAYRLFDSFEGGLLGGVEYLQPKDTSETYLKPVIGLEARYVLMTFGSDSVAAYATYEVARGSTGTLALDGGPSRFSARIFSVGLVVSFGILKAHPQIAAE